MSKILKKAFAVLGIFSLALLLFFLFLPYGVYIEYQVKFNPLQAWSFVTTQAPIEYAINSSETDQGVTGNGRTVKAFLNAIGTTRKATVKVLHTSMSDYTDYTVSTGLTITSNVAIDIDHGARLSDGGGSVNLIINAPFNPGLYQVFDWTGTGTVTFGSGAVKEVYPEWWKNNTIPGTTDMTAEIQAAIKAIEAVSGTVRLQAIDYLTSSALIINKPIWFIGAGRKATFIKPNADTFPAIQIYADTDYIMIGWKLEGFSIYYGTPAANAAAKGIFLDDTGGALRYPHLGIIQDINIHNAYHGIYDDTCGFMISLSDVFAGTITGTGFYFVNAGGKTTISFRNCYVNGCGRAFNLEGIHGLTMDVCAFDGGISALSLMRISSCQGRISGFDFEANTYSGIGGGLIDIADSYITFDGLISYNNTVSGNGGALVKTSSNARVVFNMPSLGGSRSDAYDGTNTYYTLSVGSDTNFVALNGDDITALTGAGGTAVAIADYGYKAIKTRTAPIIDNTNAATSGAGEDNLKTATIYADSLGTSGGLRVFAAGTVTNVNNGNKTVKLHFGASSWTVLPAANDNDDWWVRAEISNRAAATQVIHWRAGRCSNTAAEEVTYSGYETAAIDTTANVTLKLTGECADAGDTITQTMWIIERLNK